MISIIVPVYNVEKYIDKCLDSIVRQTYKNLQIILINDGSTDSSIDICNKWKNQDNRIEIINKINTGVSDTRNVGINHAKGEYIMFVDSDDWIEDNMCDQLLKTVQEYDADLVICAHYNESRTGTLKKSIFSNNRIVFEGDYLRENITKRIMGLTGDSLRHPEKIDALVPVWCRLYKTEIIKSNDTRFIDFNKIPSECQEFNLEYSINISKVVYINEYLYHYRRNSDHSVTKGYRNNLLNKWEFWFKYNNDLIIKRNLTYLREAYYSRIAFSVIQLGGNAIKKEKLKDIYCEIKDILNNKDIHNSFDKLDFSYFPIYWKIFFYLAKSKNTVGFFAITKLMRWMLSFIKK